MNTVLRSSGQLRNFLPETVVHDEHGRAAGRHLLLKMCGEEWRYARIQRVGVPPSLAANGE